jgi:hypothetical protein
MRHRASAVTIGIDQLSGFYLDGYSDFERVTSKGWVARMSPVIFSSPSVEHAARTPATQAKTAQWASDGVTDLHALTSAAVDKGSVPAA